MLSPKEYVSLEMACRTLKHQNVSLLTEMAKQLSSVLIPEAEFNPTTVHYADQDPLNPTYSITYEQLANYLKAATGRYVPVLFETPQRTVESCYVMVNRGWFERRTSAAMEALGIIATIQSPAANQVASSTQSVNAASAYWANQPAPMSSTGLQNLHSWLAHQNAQRKASQAASRELIARREAEERAARAEAIVAAREAQIRNLEYQLAEKDRELSNLRRLYEEARADGEQLEAQVEQVIGLSEFMNPNNPTSPPVGRQLIECWRALTQNGSIEIASSSGTGIGEHIRRWLRQLEGREPAQFQFKMFRSALTPAGRKRGGALPSPAKEENR